MSDQWGRSDEGTEVVDASTHGHGDGTRVVDLADEFKMRSVDALDLCERLGFTGLSAGNTLSTEQIDQFRIAARNGGSTPMPEGPTEGQPGGPAGLVAPAGSGALYAALGGQPGASAPVTGQQGGAQPFAAPPPFEQPGAIALPAFPPSAFPPSAFPPAAPSMVASMHPGLKNLLIGAALIVGTIVVIFGFNTIFFWPAIAGAYYVIKGLAQLISGDQ